MGTGPEIKFIVDRDDGDADRLAQGMVDAFKQIATMAESANLDCVPHAELDRFAGLLDQKRDEVRAVAPDLFPSERDNVGHVGLLSALVPARPKHAGTMQATVTAVLERAKIRCYGVKISDDGLIGMIGHAARSCACAIEDIEVTGAQARHALSEESIGVQCRCGVGPRIVHRAVSGERVGYRIEPNARAIELMAQMEHPDTRPGYAEPLEPSKRDRAAEYKREVLGEWVAAQPQPFEARDRPHPAVPRDGESGWGGPVTRGDAPPATWCDLTPSWYGRGRTYVEVARGIFDRLATIRPGPHILAVDVQPDRVLFLLPDRMSREMRNQIHDTITFEGRPAPVPTVNVGELERDLAILRLANESYQRDIDQLTRERNALRASLEAAVTEHVPGLATWKAWATVRDTDGTSRSALAWTILHLSCSTEAEHLAAELATIVADYRRDQERERAAYGKVFLYDEDAEDRVFSCDWSAEVKRKLRENAATAGPRVYVQGEDD